MVIEHINIKLMIVDTWSLKGMPPFTFKDHVEWMGLGSLLWLHCKDQYHYVIEL